MQPYYVVCPKCKNVGEWNFAKDCYFCQKCKWEGTEPEPLQDSVTVGDVKFWFEKHSIIKNRFHLNAKDGNRMVENVILSSQIANALASRMGLRVPE